RIYLGLRHEVAALRLKFALDGLGNGLVDDDRVFRRAEHAVVERLAGDDVAHRLFYVSRAFDICRRIPGAHAIRWFPRAVRRANQAHAAGRKNHRDVAMLHQLLRAFERDGRHPVDRTLWRTGATGGFVHHLRDTGDALDGCRMWTQHDGAARLERDEDFVDRGGRRVRRGNDRG